MKKKANRKTKPRSKKTKALVSGGNIIATVGAEQYEIELRNAKARMARSEVVDLTLTALTSLGESVGRIDSYLQDHYYIDKTCLAMQKAVHEAMCNIRDAVHLATVSVEEPTQAIGSWNWKLHLEDEQ